MGPAAGTDERAYPDATTYYAAPRTGCGGFDLDCDETETPQSTTIGARYCPAAGSGCAACSARVELT
jgi:hypothetical protein